MAFTERDRAAAEAALRRLTEYNDELLMRGMDRLGQMGSTLTPTPPDKFWPTTAALLSWHQQQQRSIGAAMGALNRMTRRVGTNGVNRYPTSEWGEPLALVSWMKRVHGRPSRLGVSESELGIEGVRGEVCPNCALGPLVVSTRANGFGGRQVRRTFGYCTGCKLAVDLTDSWEGEMAEGTPVAGAVADAVEGQDRSRVFSCGGSSERDAGDAKSATRAEASATGGAYGRADGAGLKHDGKPYFDEDVREWYRDTGGKVPLLAAGEDDMSNGQPAKWKDGDCWACGMAPHTRRYHDRRIAESLAAFGVKRVEEGGRVRVERAERSMRFYDERAQ
jgi:hypothetical protein